MINGYSLGVYGNEFQPTLREHRRGAKVLYCLFDFDRSVQFPIDTPYERCRLSADAATVSITPYRPPDLALGEYDYDPFAYDVGCLGNLFRVNFVVGSGLLVLSTTS